MPSSLLVIINTPARATHSLLAREALREAARAMQLPLRIETLLESGAQDPLAPEELAAAPLVLCVGEAPAQRFFCPQIQFRLFIREIYERKNTTDCKHSPVTKKMLFL